MGLICDCSAANANIVRGSYEMVRIHDAPDTATLDSSSTSGATQQNETLGRAAFDLHLHDIPLEQEQQGAAGPMLLPQATWRTASIPPTRSPK